MKNLENATGYESLLPCVPFTEIVAHQVQGRRILQQFRENLYKTVKKMFLDRNNYSECKNEKWKKRLELFFELVEYEADYYNRLYSLCNAFGEEESLTLLLIPSLKKKTMDTLITALLMEQQVKEILETSDVNLNI